MVGRYLSVCSSLLSASLSTSSAGSPLRQTLPVFPIKPMIRAGGCVTRGRSPVREPRVGVDLESSA